MRFAGDPLCPAFANRSCVINCSNDIGLYAFHPGGANVVLCDGSVHFIGYDIDATTHRYLSDRFDGNVAKLEAP